MQEIYEQYLSLTAGQRKLLCFLAYLGHEGDISSMSLYRKVEGLNSNQIEKVLKSLGSYLRLIHYYTQEYELEAVHIAPLMVYMLKEMPQWLENFDKFYKSKQLPAAHKLLDMLRRIVKGDTASFGTNGYNTLFSSDMLVPLASYPEFMPLLLEVPDYRITDFIIQLAIYQIKNDIPDPQNVLGKILELRDPVMTISQRSILHSIIALYDFFKQGRYDKHVEGYDNLYSKILVGVRALYAGDYNLAFNSFGTAIRERNKDILPALRGFFNNDVNNYAMVMAYHFKESDNHKKLTSLLNKDGFKNHHPVYWMARYLKEGTLPTKINLTTELKPPTSRLNQYLTLLLARFLQIDVELPKHFSPMPRMRFLRHELSPWLNLSQEEKQELAKDFGGQPLLSRLKYKQPWELLLEELTPKKEQLQEEVKNTRVSYIIHYERVEVREQTRLKSGAWGAGKRMSVDTFRRGTDFMDDTDRRIAQTISGYYSYDIDIKKALPHLIGSDRVYTGNFAPFMPVTIVEEKPYLMIERTNKAFTVKSNVDKTMLDSAVVYKKDSESHYTVITMTDRQRLYYRKLLTMGSFPLEAEQQLREFLPKVSDVVEVHSDLVEGGTTLQQRDGTSQLCLQAMPNGFDKTLFNVYCYARPLAEGTALLEPGKGLNPCVIEEDGVRYQVKRDVKGERTNYQQLTTFIADNDLQHEADDEPFANHTPIVLLPEQLLQLMEFIGENSDHFYLMWPEGGQIQLKTSNPAAWNISLRSNSGWFEVEGEIPIDDDTVLTTAQLLQLVADSPANHFIRLGESDFLRISDCLRKQLQRLESLTVNDHGHLHISELHASLLGSALSGEIEVKHDKKIEQLQKKIKKSMALQPAIPKNLKADLRDYQTDGFQWMTRMTSWGAGVCLADDMGLGKTVQTIAFMLHTAADGPALVAAPASVVLNWRRELERFAPTLNVVVLNSSPDRHAAISTATCGDVVLTTYGLFVTESSDLLAKKWNTVCLDEAHVIKNRETKTSGSVMKLQARNRIILTGTPVQNHLGELWNLYQFINPGLLGSYDQFQKKYINPIELQQDKDRSKQLKRIVQPFILRRTKQEVIEELPDKTEINMPVELSDDELAVYEVIRRRAKKLLDDEQGNSVSVNTLAEITRLRQAACSAQLTEKGWTGECSKINTLMTLLEEIVGGGNSVLVFSQFTSFLTLVRETLDKAKVDYIYLDGSVPMKQREKAVQSFQRGEHPVFLISLKAGGLGLNLTGANYVIHLDPWWNPAVEQQATDRAYRIGQQQNVTVYHLISQHTIEEKILRLHDTKRNLADALLEGTSESHKLTANDLLKLLT